jgi:hypothetical protein
MFGRLIPHQELRATIVFFDTGFHQALKCRGGKPDYRRLHSGWRRSRAHKVLTMRSPSWGYASAIRVRGEPRQPHISHWIYADPKSLLSMTLQKS